MMKTVTIGLAALALMWAGSAGAGDDRDTQNETVERMAHEHRGDAPVANPVSEAAPAVPVTGETVVYATVDGRSVKGYLARPEGGAEDLPGLIVIHEWWGLNDNIRAMTRRLAGEGYAALAVDLYGGRTAEEPTGARELAMEANDHPPQALSNLRQAYGYLANDVGAPKVASIGWCFGGGWSLRTALALPRTLSAVIIYYGSLVTDRDQLATLEMPILGFFGGRDPSIPPAEVQRFEGTLHDLGKDATIIVYPDAGHAFANPSGRNYDPEAAADAWQKTVRFLADNL